jgi:hypothetical protein
LVLEFLVLVTIHHAKISRFEIKSFLKLVTALYVSPYLVIFRCIEIRGNCCAFRTTAIRVFVFVMFLNEVDVNINTAHFIGNRHTKKDNTCGIEGGPTLTSFKNSLMHVVA